MDNFFTSINLADKLKAHKTTLLGTVRKQRKKIPKVEIPVMMKSKPLYSSSGVPISIQCHFDNIQSQESKVGVSAKLDEQNSLH